MPVMPAVAMYLAVGVLCAAGLLLWLHEQSGEYRVSLGSARWTRAVSLAAVLVFTWPSAAVLALAYRHPAGRKWIEGYLQGGRS